MQAEGDGQMDKQMGKLQIKASGKYIWQSDFIPPSDVSTHAHVRFKVPGRWKVDVSLRNTCEEKLHGRASLSLSQLFPLSAPFSDNYLTN